MITAGYQFDIVIGVATLGRRGNLLPGDEARAMAADVIRGYLESLAKDGLPISKDTAPEPIKEKITVVLQAA